MFDELWDPVTGTYKIQPGDNLTEISKELEVPIDSLVSFNNLSNPDDIKVGQTLLYRREPGFLDYLSRAFGKGKMNESINNKINANIKDVSKLEQESLSSFFNLGKSSDLTNYLKENHNIDLYTNTENLNTLYKFFRDKNWSRNQTLAILSSIIAESGGDPYKKQIGGSGYGLLQYTDPARKQIMLNYKSKKYPNNELLRQAEFIDLELRGDKSVMPKGQYRQWLGNNGAYYKEFNNPNASLDRLTSIITTSYIRPGKPHLSRRINLTNVLDNIVSKNYNPNLIAENRFGGIISKKQSGGEITAIMGGLGTAANLAGGIWGIVDSFKNKQYPQALQGIGNVLGQGASMAGMFAEDGGKITKGEKGLDVSTIKVDPSIFTSWNAIKLDPIEIKREEAPGFNMADYLFKDVARNYDLTSNKKSTKDTSNNSENTASEEEKPNNIEKINLGKDNKVKPNNTYYNYNKSKWIQDLSESYKKAGITNPEALKYLLAQDALESGWGKSAQGQFNYGNLTTGSSWKGKYVQGRDKDANGNPISQKFRSYNSMDEYTKDKIDFLTRLYDFNQNDDFSTFISKLTGNNKGHRRYAEARNYGESLSSVFKSLINKHQEGGILLFGNPETSEMLTYKMPDGSIKTIPNPGAGFISGTDPVGQVVVEGAVLNKPLGWAFGKAINWAKSLLNKSKGKEYTERLIKALGDKYKGGSDSEMFTPDQKYFIDYLKSLNVDVSKFGSADIRRLQNLRKKVLLETIPEDERVGLVSFLKNNSGTSLDIDLYKSRDVIGNISAKSTNKGSDIGYVESYRPKSERHVSEGLYNATIETSKQIGSPGIISGKRLLSPEQTYKTWNKFPNKRLLSKDGEHTFNSGDNVIKSGESYTINNGNVYLLKEPSRKVKTKASNAFNPSIIDKNGKITIDWNNKDIFKSLVPIYLYNENTN